MPSAPEIREEWESRSRRPGSQSVLSTRYPADKCDEIAARFAEAQLEFMGGPATFEASSVCEVGCGIGRLTRRLAPFSARHTCIDVSAGMLSRNLASLMDLSVRSGTMTFHLGFAEEVLTREPSAKYDFAITSLVLIHLVHEAAFRAVVEGLQRVLKPTGCLFVFEHCPESSQRYDFTSLRTASEIEAAFAPHWTAVERRKFLLHSDDLMFFKFATAKSVGHRPPI